VVHFQGSRPLVLTEKARRWGTGGLSNPDSTGCRFCHRLEDRQEVNDDRIFLQRGGLGFVVRLFSFHDVSSVSEHRRFSGWVRSV
jgi:hypothetical protein